MYFQHALTRRPPASMARGITSQTDLPDVNLAIKQHENYIEILRKLGLSVTNLEAEEAFPDSHFIEDTAIIFQKNAILTRPGAPERGGEVDTIEASLRATFPIKKLKNDDEILVDGGDVLFGNGCLLAGVFTI